MYNNLRAFLYNPSHTDEADLVKNILSSWEDGYALSLIPTNFPNHIVEEAIIRIDPNEVINLEDGTIAKRDLAIADSENLAAVVLTSGTVSRPKPVELSFDSMHESVNSFYRFTNLAKDAKWLCILPPHYIAGLNIFAKCFINNSEIVYHSSFDVERIRNEIETSQVEAMSLVPTQIEKLIENKVDLSPLHTVLVGGAQASEKLKQLCFDLKINIHFTYGMTETWGGICHDGVFFDNTEGRINDGILEIKTTSIMTGYRHDFGMTSSRFTQDNYFVTGDRAIMEGSKLKILGRADEVINSGGIKVDPIQVENAIRNTNIEQSFVICGTKNDSLGDVVTIVFENSLPPNFAIADFRKSLKALLPSTHLPARVAIIDSFYTGESQKIRRGKISNDCVIKQDYFEENKTK